MVRSDIRNKEIALGRIKRLASSGLALHPFVQTLFELLNDAVPSAANKLFLAFPPWNGAERIANSSEGSAALVRETAHVRCDPESQGIRLPQEEFFKKTCAASATVFPMEYWTLPTFYRREYYNEVARPIGFHHMLWVVYREAGSPMGCQPLWRRPEQKPFSRDDTAFFEQSAPHIAHGLKMAYALAQRAPAVSPPDGFVPSSLWGTGVLLFDHEGRLVAMDDEAKAIFTFTYAPPGELYAAFEERTRSALAYIGQTVYELFKGDGARNGPPAVSVFADPTGVSLKLRGVTLSEKDGRDHVAVLVERGESAEQRRQRIMHRWGLTAREAQILGYMAEGKTNREIAIILGTSHRTVGKQLERIFLELKVETRTAAAAMLHEALAGARHATPAGAEREYVK